MKDYPHAVTQKCGNCGKTFTCKGEGWNLIEKNKGLFQCPYAHTGCNCGECNMSRGSGCEIIDLKEVVCFT
jgi:hypothetical protein